MIDERRNNLFHVCSLIEYIARETKNHRSDIVQMIGADGLVKLLKDAPVNHCLTFEQVSTEVIEKYDIPGGEYDTITNCKYSVPSYVDIGKLYTYLIEGLSQDNTHDVETMISLFSSFISDEISNFKTGVYFENLSYLTESYKAGRLL